jgi:hypothetical protein
MVEKPVPLSPLFRSSTYFPADAIKCLCNNVGLCFVFWNKFVLLVDGRGHGGLFFEVAVVWFTGHL